jgi:crotonobetainyl-CoA:carnitine CoA-transferase CaiB-like acyl-CoA transferase
MPAFGATGPWAKFRAYGSTVEQSAGLPHLQGSEHQPPTMLHVAFGDAIAGLYGSAALLTALFHKKNTGRGQFVDLSQVECLLPHAVHGIVHQSVYHQPPKRQGNYHPDYFIHAVFACAGEEQWLLLQVETQEQWILASGLIPLLKAFDNLTADERRVQFLNIQASLVGWMATQQVTVLMHQFQSAGITAVALNRVADLMDDPHLLARGYMQFIERDFMGQQPHPISPWRVGQDPITIKTSAPTLGQHNRRVLGGMLGLCNAQLEALDRQGVIGSKPRLA